MRDSYRQRAYDAESRCESRLRYGFTAGAAANPAVTDFYRRLSLNESLAFINKVKREIAVTVNDVRFPESRTTATWYNGPKRLVLPPWARNKDIIVHELAHAVVGRSGPGGRRFPGPSHGAEWVEARLVLTAAYGSDEIAAELRKAYHEKNVPTEAGPQQAITFLNMARRKPDPSARRIRIILNTGEVFMGRLVEWDGEAVVIGRRPHDLVAGDPDGYDLAGEPVRILCSVVTEELRYATFVDSEEKPFPCPCPGCRKAYATEHLMHRHMVRFAMWGRGDSDLIDDHFWEATELGLFKTDEWRSW